ncbi:hypothetical protein AB0N62_31560 [Streptomyces sp. NPDC093982]|uniref:three-helix bundle dimerization domain-containing protein n=1 Tax=Streptomyces sp. NPDC093982 TaxID=3155077 RepID=UPI0034142285
MTASPPPVLPEDRLASGIARLALHYRGRFSAETIQRLVIDSYQRLAELARVRTHLVVPAEHLATERLAALAHIEGAPGCGLPRVLFVCSHNAGRSQMPPPSSPTARADTWSSPPRATLRPRSNRSSPRRSPRPVWTSRTRSPSR